MTNSNRHNFWIGDEPVATAFVVNQAHKSNAMWTLQLTPEFAELYSWQTNEEIIIDRKAARKLLQLQVDNHREDENPPGNLRVKAENGRDYDFTVPNGHLTQLQDWLPQTAKDTARRFFTLLFPTPSLAF